MNVVRVLSLFVALLLATAPCYAKKMADMSEETSPTPANTWTFVEDNTHSETKKATLRTLVDAALAEKNQYYAGSDLAAKVMELGSTVCELIVDQDVTVSSTFSIPENILLNRINGAIITVTAGNTLTVGRLGAIGDTQMFAGDGSVELTSTTVVSAGLFLSAGQPNGSSNNSSEVQKAIAALPADGGLVILPMNANRYRMNITLPANVRLEGVAPQGTKVGPYNNSNPVIAGTGVRVQVRYLYFYGAGAGTSTCAIRHDRSIDGPGGGLNVEHCRFYGFTKHIDIQNNYYNEIRSNTFTSMTYGIYGRNAFNRTLITGNKFSAFDYGVAILYDSVVDANTSHNVTLLSNSYESPNQGGIGEYFYNSGGHVSEHAYFEGFAAKNGFPVLEAGGPVYGWHGGDADSSYLIDSSGRDFTKLGISVGMTIHNRTDGSSGTISAIGDAYATNDKITATMSGGDGDWDENDYYLIDADATEEYRGGNLYVAPDCNTQSEAVQLLKGINGLSSSIVSSWGARENGTINHSTLISSYSYTANERKVVSVTSLLSSYPRLIIGAARISYDFTDTSGSPGSVTFRPVGGSSLDVYHQHAFTGNGVVSGSLEVPLDPNMRFEFGADKNGTLNIRVHGLLH